MWRRNFPLRAFSDTRTEIISNRVAYFWSKLYAVFEKEKIKQILWAKNMNYWHFQNKNYERVKNIEFILQNFIILHYVF